MCIKIKTVIILTTICLYEAVVRRLQVRSLVPDLISITDTKNGNYVDVSSALLENATRQGVSSALLENATRQGV